jgi:hypothetical protein
MSPLSPFLLANVAFFFAPALTDLTLGLDQQVPATVLREFRTDQQNAGNGIFAWQLHVPVTFNFFPARASFRTTRRDCAGRAFRSRDFFPRSTTRDPMRSANFR